MADFTNDVELIKVYVKKYPEMNFLAGAAESTPEGSPVLGKNAMVPKVFEKYHETAIEGDRTFLSVLLFDGVLRRDKSKFPNLSTEKFEELIVFTRAIVGEDAALIELVFYSLACNDLGKTEAVVEENIRLRGRKAPDHDQLLYEVVEDNPSLFPGLLALSDEQQFLYKEGLKFNFNLGQFVQGENLPFNLAASGEVTAKSKAIRLLAEVFDFAGATGHINITSSILMTNVNCELFLQAVRDILAFEHTSNHEAAKQIYTTYYRFRALKCGLVEVVGEEELFLIFGKIAALSRAVDPAQGQMIQTVWNSLTPEEREILRHEMLVTGFEKQGILIYYFPAVLANAIKALGNKFTEGLLVGLQRVADVYQQNREKLIRDGVSDQPGVYIENVNNLAKEMTKLTPKTND